MAYKLLVYFYLPYVRYSFAQTCRVFFWLIFFWGGGSHWRIFSLIFGRGHYRWRTADFYQHSAFMVIEPCSSLPDLMRELVRKIDPILRGKRWLFRISSVFQDKSVSLSSKESLLTAILVSKYLWNGMKYCKKVK